MSERNLLEGLSPVTQSLDAGKALAKFLGLSEELPESIALANGARLTLGSKKDAYYYTTLQSCTCMAGQNHRICWHRRDLCEAAREAQKAAETMPTKSLLEEMEEQGYEMSFTPGDEPEENPRTAKIEAAKVKVAESRQQARDYQARQRALKAQRLSSPDEGESLIHMGGFRPAMPEEA